MHVTRICFPKMLTRSVCASGILPLCLSVHFFLAEKVKTPCLHFFLFKFYFIIIFFLRESRGTEGQRKRERI